MSLPATPKSWAINGSAVTALMPALARGTPVLVLSHEPIEGGCAGADCAGAAAGVALWFLRYWASCVAPTVSPAESAACSALYASLRSAIGFPGVFVDQGLNVRRVLHAIRYAERFFCRRHQEFV